MYNTEVLKNIKPADFLSKDAHHFYNETATSNIPTPELVISRINSHEGAKFDQEITPNPPTYAQRLRNKFNSVVSSVADKTRNLRLPSFINRETTKSAAASVGVAGIILTTLLTPDQNAQAKNIPQESSDNQTFPITLPINEVRFDPPKIELPDMGEIVEVNIARLDQHIRNTDKQLQAHLFRSLDSAEEFLLKPIFPGPKETVQYLTSFTPDKLPQLPSLANLSLDFSLPRFNLFEQISNTQATIKDNAVESTQPSITPIQTETPKPEIPQEKIVEVKSGDTASKLAGSYDNLARFIVDNADVFKQNRAQAKYVDEVVKKVQIDPNFNGLKTPKDLELLFRASHHLTIGSKVKVK